MESLRLYIETGKPIPYGEWENLYLIVENNLTKKFLQQYIMMIEWVNVYINSLTDEEFKMELSPGKNHGIWILGHLITSDDDFSIFMGKDKLLFPEYQELFGQGSKPGPVENYPDVSLLKEQWNRICEKNKKIYVNLRDEEFDEPHANITDDRQDYFKTKGRVIMAWQLHQMYHCGQLSVLVARTGKKIF